MKQFKRGDRVRILKGASITSTHPQKPHRIVERAFVVTLHDTMNPIAISNHLVLNDRDYRAKAEANGVDIQAIEKMREANTMEYYRGMVEVSKAQVMWAGSGGYWCYVDVDQVEAYQ